MKTSQKALLAGICFVAFVLVVGAVWSRISLTTGIKISGERSTLTPTLSNFTGVDASGTWDVTATRGDTWRVELDVPVEFVDRLEARVEDDRLVLGLDNGTWLGGCSFPDRCRLKANISLPELRAVNLSGATQFNFRDFDGTTLAIGMSGAGEIDGDSGRYDDLELTVSGAGNADLSGVTTTNAAVSVSGAAHIELHMGGGRLSGNLSGVSSLEYSGTVSEVNVSESGPSNVRRKN